jgi:hypothetical protein
MAREDKMEMAILEIEGMLHKDKPNLSNPAQVVVLLPDVVLSF